MRLRRRKLRIVPCIVAAEKLKKEYRCNLDVAHIVMMQNITAARGIVHLDIAGKHEYVGPVGEGGGPMQLNIPHAEDWREILRAWQEYRN